MNGDLADREHPTPEQLSAYQANELSPEEDDAIQEHVTGCDLCIERLLELQRFLDFVPETREGVADLETAAEWRRLRVRIEEAQIESGSPAFARRSYQRRVLGSLKLAYGLVAALALGLVSLSIYIAGLRQELRRPDMNSRSVVLPLPSLARGVEDQVKSIALAPQEETKVTFSLEAPETPAFSQYRLEVRDSKGRLIVTSDGLENRDGFTFTLPTQMLSAGSYLIEVRGLQGSSEPLVGQYRFRIRRSKAP